MGSSVLIVRWCGAAKKVEGHEQIRNGALMWAREVYEGRGVVFKRNGKVDVKAAL